MVMIAQDLSQCSLSQFRITLMFIWQREPWGAVSDLGLIFARWRTALENKRPFRKGK